MSQPVKLSDELVLDARIAGKAQERSIAGQVEFWAKLGRSMELLLDGRQVLTLCRTVGATPLADLVDLVDTPAGRDMLKSYLDSEPYPHFEAHPGQAGLLVRIDENGERTVGRFINREFIPMPLEGELDTQPLHKVQSPTESVAA
jgi:ParD-like antitoxin of type II bacterial toxin-antitoxin system